MPRKAEVIQQSEPLRFDAATHTYTLGTIRLPSVTKALEVLEDFSHVDREAWERARIRGQHVHSAIALMLNDELDWGSLDSELVPYVKGAERFLADSELTVISHELRLHHSQLGYAGTLDLLGEWKFKLSLFDWKSGLVPRTVGPQTAAYGEAYKDSRRLRVQRRYCVQLNPELPLGYKVHELDKANDFSTFCAALTVHRFRNAA